MSMYVYAYVLCAYPCGDDISCEFMWYVRVISTSCPSILPTEPLSRLAGVNHFKKGNGFSVHMSHMPGFDGLKGEM